jgi:hypothetical protein
MLVSRRALPSDVGRRLCPAHNGPRLLRGSAPGVGLRFEFTAKGRTKGLAQEGKTPATAGHSRRRTSDGEAGLSDNTLVSAATDKLKRIEH